METEVLGDLSIFYAKHDQMEEAMQCALRALAVSRKVGDQRVEALHLVTVADLLISLGKSQSAERHLIQAIEIGDSLWYKTAGVARATLALVRIEQGDLDAARTLLEKADPMVRGAHQMELGKLLCTKARVAHLSSDPEAAETARAEAESIADGMGLGPKTTLRQTISKLHALMQ